MLLLTRLIEPVENGAMALIGKSRLPCSVGRLLTFEASLLALRRDPRILKLPPYLSALCIVVGIAWLLVLPLDEYARNTYVSENALLPGQVHTYFEGSEHNVFRAYRHEVFHLIDRTLEEYIRHLTADMSSVF